jgi:hypothetical protein
MNCRDVREIADSFLCEELLTETNHEILRHLETCPSCRTEIDARRRLRGALRDAFNRSSELQPSDAFRSRLRDQLHDASAHGSRAWSLSWRWLALAATVVLAVGVAGVVLLMRSAGPMDAVARDAIGDHQNCALKFRLEEKPVSLEHAAREFDSAYRVLVSTPPDTVSTPDGPAQVVERHSCAYDGRRFGHIVMKYRGRVVSLLMTGNEGQTGDVGAEATPYAIGRPVDGLSVVAVNGKHHAIMLVSDLDSAALEQLSQSVSVPLARRLEVSLMPERGRVAALPFAPLGR